MSSMLSEIMLCSEEKSDDVSPYLESRYFSVLQIWHYERDMMRDYWNSKKALLNNLQKTSSTKIKLAALAMWAIVSSTQAQANDLIVQCDFNHNWIIDGRTYLKNLKKKLKSDWDYSEEDKEIYKIALKNAKKERHCKTEIDKQEIVQIEQDTKQEKTYLVQLDASIEWLKRKLAKVNEEIKKIEAELSKDKAELREMKKILEKQRQWMIRKMEEIANMKIS